ncbi:glycosyltransferase [Riemerella anatipestifer]|uniref:glycosyltransferase n=1 Tax=Riemerella anatipestifer TaxID=34085 RepID=UPI00129E7E49|nr:glycosyltransferase [Riemerella anatipestifer]MRM95871.1 glycosyltransferase [Riemerella anatipestifer]
MSFFSLFKIPSISYGITVCNEDKELRKLLSELLPLIDQNKDEVIILQDTSHHNPNVNAIIDEYKGYIIHLKSELNGDFSAFKNNLIKGASKDYLFQIDADEIPNISLIKNLKFFLRINFNRDVFLVPRINIVNGITQEHIDKWQWKVNKKGHINFPDYQERILKLNGKIFWKNKVHEVLTGYKKKKKLPSNSKKYCLIHEKSIAKQEAQNKSYEKLD